MSHEMMTARDRLVRHRAPAPSASAPGRSAAGCGAAPTSGSPSRRSRPRIDEGVSLIDTAPAYGKGLAEEIVGKAIRGRRDKVVLATKCGLVWHTTKGNHFFDYDGKPVHRYLGAESIAYELEQSLRRLGTDYVDLYITHWQDPTTPIAETMEALEKLKQQGKIRAIGASNLSPRRTGRLCRGRRTGRDPGGVQHGQARHRGVRCCRSAAGMACRMLSYSSLALGLLSGPHRPGPRIFRRRPAQGQSALLGRQPAEGRRPDGRHRAGGRGAWRDAGTDRHRLDAAAARNHLRTVRRAQSRPGARERRRRAHPAFVERDRRHKRGRAAAI